MTTARDRPPEEAAEDTSFARGLRLLLVVADRGEVRADELSAVLEMPVSTVYRYLRTLVEFGFVDRTGGTFRLGPKLLIGTGANVTAEQLIRHADPVLRRLVDESGETAIVVRRIGLSSVCLHAIESPEPVRVTYQTGSMSPLHAGAPARTLLAFAPPEILAEVQAGDMARLTPDTPTAMQLVGGLDEIVRAGTAVSAGERTPGAVAVAAPVFREDGIVGAVALVGPAFRCGAEWRQHAVRIVHDAAATLTAALAEDRAR
jgi:IclR family transcriptional regulator, acetate operon repressor